MFWLVLGGFVVIGVLLLGIWQTLEQIHLRLLKN